MGGDEFLVLLPGVAAQAAQTMATVLRDALQRPMEIEGKTVTVGASVGVSVYPRDGVDVTTLLSAADQAMYRAKGREHRR